MTALSDKMKSALILQVLKDHLTESLTLQDAYLLIKDSPLRNMNLLEFCNKICEKPPLTESKEEPLVVVNLESPEEFSKVKKKWEEWPIKVQEELLYVLGENDRGSRKITMNNYMIRMKDHWKIEATEHSLKSFCKDHGRKGWSK